MIYLIIYLTGILISYYLFRKNVKDMNEWTWTMFFITCLFSLVYPVTWLIFIIIEIQDRLKNTKPPKWL